MEIRWEDGRAREVSLAASLDGAFPLSFHHGEKLKSVACGEEEVSCPDQNGLPLLAVRAGKTYRITLAPTKG